MHHPPHQFFLTLRSPTHHRSSSHIHPSLLLLLSISHALLKSGSDGAPSENLGFCMCVCVCVRVTRFVSGVSVCACCVQYAASPSSQRARNMTVSSTHRPARRPSGRVSRLVRLHFHEAEDTVCDASGNRNAVQDVDPDKSSLVDTPKNRNRRAHTHAHTHIKR